MKKDREPLLANEEKIEKTKETLDNFFLFDPRMDKMKNFTVYFPHNNAIVSAVAMSKSIGARTNRKMTTNKTVVTRKSFKTNRTKLSRPSFLSLKKIFK